MAGYLIGKEGPLAGLVLRFEEGTEWVIGRDPDVVSWVLEDPKVSRKHAICRLVSGEFIFENLSGINPATLNEEEVVEPVALKEGDVVRIGDTFFQFSHTASLEEKNDLSAIPTLSMEESSDLSSVSVESPDEIHHWMIKVITGPNTGGEFYMRGGKSYILGKDVALCDVLLQDLSVSRQHSRVSVDDNDEVFIEDLGSRNGTWVNGKIITERHLLKSEDLVVVGTTSFLVVDRDQIRETLISEVPQLTIKPDGSLEREGSDAKGWAGMAVVKRHLVFMGILGVVLLTLLIGVVLLFQGKPVIVPHKHETEQLAEIIKKYTDIQYSYKEGSGKLFLMGHVITPVEKQELLYQLNGLSFLNNINESVVIDEYVWDNVNALLTTNSAWQGVSIHSPVAGKFVLRGYLETLEQAQALTEYLNMNFPYLDCLENQVVIEVNLKMQIESLLIAKGFNNVQYQLSDGEVVLSGRVDGKDQSKFELLLKKLNALPGIRVLKNYVVYMTKESSLVDLSDKYRVMGYSKKDGKNEFIVINGKILALGDNLDGMVIIQISTTLILLEKDGLKFKINYNLQ